MSTPLMPNSLEEQIDQWRSYLRRRQAIHSVDVAELEDHLREQVSTLVDAGLAVDEAFLVAVKRMGDLDTLSREFAREHSDRLWKQLVIPNAAVGTPTAAARRDGVVAFGLAVMAAILIKLPSLFGITLDGGTANELFYMRNLSFFVLPLLTGYFIWKRRLAMRTVQWLALGFFAALLVMNTYPFLEPGNTLVLAVLHLPIALWLLVGVAYAGGRWNSSAGRMDFIRFSGELFIYYALIAAGGGVLTGFMMAIFGSIGIDMETFFSTWMLPCCATGAVLIASWLVEAKQSVIENMAPVLTRLFTPLFAVVLVAFLVALAVTGNGIDVQREMLILFDGLLIVVVALLLYSISARDAVAPPNAFDWVQLVLVVSALLANGVALWAIGSRIAEMGFTPNRTAALGMNLILIANLGWSAVLSFRFLRSRGSFTALERWQTGYLPVYAIWAAIVVVVFPWVFRFA
jgi:hypothetical protein